MNAAMLRQRPTTRWVLTCWFIVLITALLAAVTVGMYLLIERDLERRTFFQLRRHLLEHWNPAPLDAHGDPQAGRGGPFRVRFLDTSFEEPLNLVMPSNSSQDWSRLATVFIHVRYYDMQLRRRMQLGGPADHPRERLDALQPLLAGTRAATNYTSHNSFEGWLMWAQIVRDPQGRPAGILELGMGAKPTEDLLTDVGRSLIMAGVGALLLGTALATFLARYLCLPLENMDRAMAQISAGDFTARAAERGPVELQSIALNFNRMVAQLSHSFEGQRRFVADASHELKTPLTSIQTMVELLKEHSDMREDRRERAYQVIDRELTRVNQLVHDLLTLSRLDQSAESSSLLDLAALLQTVAAEYRVLHPALQFQCSCETAPMQLKDAGGCSRAVRNLLDNAFAHTTPPGCVTLRLSRQERSFLIEVVDEGSGIPAADLPHVTRRFYRSDKSRSRSSGGSGLGLSIVRSWVELNGGRLELNSIEGKGTAVKLWLPADDDTAHPGR